MSNSEHKARIDTREVAAGLLLLITGGAAALQAYTFDDESRMFPLVVAIALAVTGVAIAMHSVLKPTVGEPLNQKLGSVILAALIVAAWAAAFAGGAGFMLPTFAMQVALIWLTGIRRPIYIVGIAALVTALAYLLFVSLLDIPMPPSFMPGVLQGY